MTRHLRLLIMLGVLGLVPLLTACAVVTASGAPAGTSTVAAPQPSYTVAVRPAATPPKPTSAPPALKTTGAAWPAILASLAAYGQWILANPDPALVGAIATPGCAMSDLVSTQAQALFTEKAYLKPSPVGFTTVVGPSPATGGQVTLDVVATRAAEPVLSRAKGVQIQTFEAFPSTALQITLNRGADNRWRFCSVNAMSDTGAPDDPSVPLL